MQRSVVLRRLFGEAKPYLPRLAFSLLLAAIAGTGMVAFAPAFDHVIKDVINEPHHDLHRLWQIVGIVFVVNLVANIAAYGSAYLTAWSGQHLITELRVRLLERALRLSSLSFDAWRPGELLTRSTNDLTLMGDAVSVALPQLVQVIVTFVVSLVYMVYTDWFLTIVLFIIAPVISLAVARFNRLIAIGSGEAQRRIADLTSNLSEVLHAQRVVKAFRRESFEVERFGSNAACFFQASVRLTQLIQMQVPIVGMMIVVTLLVIVFLSAREVSLGHMDSGAVFRFWTLVALSINPMNRIAAFLGDISRGLIGANRVYEILDLPIERDHEENTMRIAVIRGGLTFEKVRFRYPGNMTPILDGFNLEIAPGTVLALVGPSGSGKTTIAELIPRFYDVDGGRILLDGIDLTWISLTQLREAIGIVPQEPQLFRATIAENIRYGRLDASDDDIYRAAREANAEEFILDLPAGYNTLIGESGVRLSGGQRQRVAIARAIVRDPKVIILDEATSALDSHSEYLIEQAFDRVFAGRTTIVIAHRLSTIRRADRILYVAAGRICEAGTHQELLAVGGLYAELYAAQMRSM